MSENGKVPPYIDYENRIFVARDGTQVHLATLSGFVLERLYRDKSGKPKVPRIEVEIGGKHKVMQENPDDPAYQKASQAWEAEKNLRITRYCLTEGIADTPPDDFIERTREYFPETPLKELRYLWMVELLGEEKEDWECIIGGMLGQSVATEEGVKQAMDQFPGNSERLAG